MAEKEMISERISLKAPAVSGSCKIKTICWGETFLLYTTRVSKLSPSTAQLCHDLSAWAWLYLVGQTIQGSLQKPPGNKWKPFFWPDLATRQPGRFLSLDKGKTKEGKPSELGLAEAAWWERTERRAGLFQGWLPARQLAGWTERTCIMNIFAATVSAQPGLSVSTVGRFISARWLMCTEGELLAKDEMAQLADSKTTAPREWRQRKESRKQEKKSA